MENVDPFMDCCVHGGVYLKIADVLVSDGEDDSWTLSTTAFNLLRSVGRDHHLLGEEPLVPHCGFTMWPIDGEPDGLYMPNCNISINWSVTHDGDEIRHDFNDGKVVLTRRSDWSKAVCAFSDEVREFFMSAWPKQIPDDLDRRGFDLFMRLWSQHRSEADAS
jgi:hypothetical protein